MNTQTEDDLRRMYAAFDTDHDRLRDQLMASLPEQTQPLRTPSLARRGWQWFGQTKMKRRVVRSVAAAIPLMVGGLLIYAMLFPSGNDSAIVLADVLAAFERDLTQNDYIHLAVTMGKLKSTDANFRHVTEAKVWIQRPSKSRMERRFWTLFEMGWLGSLVPDAVFKQVWNGDDLYVWDPNTKEWGLLVEDDFIRKHRSVYREWRRRSTELSLQAKWYAKPDWSRGTFRAATGRVIGQGQIQGQPATIYEFREFEERVCKCWLRDSDKRLLKMVVYKSGESQPHKTIEVRAYGGSPPAGLFDPTPSRKLDYAEKRQLGYEDKPQLIHPDVVAVVQEESSARFYPLSVKPGQTRDQAVSEAVASRQPAVEVTIEQNGVFEIKVRPPGAPSDDEPAVYRTSDIGPFTDPMCGVLCPQQGTSKGRQLRFIPRSKHDGRGQIVVTFTYYTVRNVVSYAKVAFDANADGQMDAWCQLPSDQVIEDWLKSGCERAAPSRRR